MGDDDIDLPATTAVRARAGPKGAGPEQTLRAGWDDDSFL